MIVCAEDGSSQSDFAQTEIRKRNFREICSKRRPQNFRLGNPIRNIPTL